MTRLGICPLVAGIVASALAGTAAAQGRHVFVIDQAQSAFTFSGSVTLAPITSNIVGQPNTFNPSGQASADVTVAAGAITAGQLVTGNGTIVQVPTLNAILPNPIPIFPPLATIQVTGAQVVFTSVDPITLAPAAFAVGGGGSFNTAVMANLLSGTVTLTGLINQVVSLAGLQSSAQAVSGTLVPTAAGMRLSVPLVVSFPFTEPNTGATGTLNLNGTLHADDRPLASNVDTISLGTGGVQTLTLSRGTANGGRVYLLLGSATGTAPGINLGAVTLPLNPDGYLMQTLSNPNAPPLSSSFASLDAIGVATAAFAIPRLNLPALVGLRLDHAYVVISGFSFVATSNAVPVTFTQ